MNHSARKPDGGFVFISAAALVAAWWAYRRRLIQLADLCIWFACHELKAKRCGLQKGRVPSFTVAEVTALLDRQCSPRIDQRFRRLCRARLLCWSQSRIEFFEPSIDEADTNPAGLRAMLQHVPNRRRKVPVPRRLIRFLARSRRPAIIATALGHLLRCVYHRRGQCSPRGLCKATWIAAVFELDLRSVKCARKELERLSLLIRHPTSQWRMNRWGPSVEFNLQWTPPIFVKRRKPPPRRPKIGIVSPPPDSNRELSSKVTTRNASPPRPGVFHVGRTQCPTLRNVRREDLADDAALGTLYEEAVGRGILRNTECDRLRFFGAAEHAVAKSSRNPAGLFVAFVRRGLWSHITQCEEDAARRRLGRCWWSGNTERTSAREPARHRSLSHTDDTSDARRARIRERIRRSLQSVVQAA
jgi:hypothetical protein